MSRLANESSTRRQFLDSALRTATVVAGCGLGPLATRAEKGKRVAASDQQTFALKYMVGSCLFGTTALSEIVPRIAETGARAIDVWPLPHGNQREQIDDLGEDALADLLTNHGVTLGCITQYKLGPFALEPEMQLAKRHRCRTIVTGGRGPTDVRGRDLKTAVGKFVEQMKPHLDVAERLGVTIAIENHSHNLIDSPDSLKWLVELCPTDHLAVALAPYHLPQNETAISQLIRDLGNRIAVFYAWQHGMGCTERLPKEEELLQMPGRGRLDFAPLLAALRDVGYTGWTEIFMHPVPRGIPILSSTDAVIHEINRSRDYLDGLLRSLE